MFYFNCCVQRTIPPIHPNPSRASMTYRPSVSIPYIRRGYRLKSPFVIKDQYFSLFSYRLHSPPFTVCRTSPKVLCAKTVYTVPLSSCFALRTIFFFFLHGSNSLRLKRLLPAKRTTLPVLKLHRPARLLRKTYVPGGSTLPFSALPKLFASPPLRSTSEPPPFNLKCSFVGSPRSFLGANSFLFLCDKHIITGKLR